jgi:DNA-binding protein H-NS
MAPSEMTLAELEAHIAEAKATLAAKRQERTAEVIASIKAMAKEVGLTVTIHGLPSAEGNPAKGAKIPPKYRCPTTGKTWTGRGMRPNWMNGADPERFRI